ncbi:hypothetical protein [Ekhidna sp.]|uniref:hypothetical protein n=1 Tax=Ekhidna sp. TaxID=2608089 RepID=UPI0032ED1113
MEENQLKLTDVDKANLLETAKWGKFLGIVGFVMSGLIILMALVFIGGMGRSMEVYPGLGSGIGFFYILASLLYIFPSLYVYRFSAHIKAGIQSGDQEMYSSALIT